MEVVDVQTEAMFRYPVHVIPEDTTALIPPANKCVGWSWSVSEGARYSKGSSSGGLLVEADHVSARVSEPRGDLGRVRADRLRDLAPIADDRFDGRGDAVNHDVNEKARCCGG